MAIFVFVLQESGRLSLDDCVFFLMDEDEVNEYSQDDKTTDEYNPYLFEDHRSLERLSIKNALYGIEDSETQNQQLPQEMLVKMVRRHPTLHWLRSDLSAESVAMLKQERPEITFVSD